MWTERQSGITPKRTKHDHRSPFERDNTRIIHCPSFRRLQRKTQILGTDEGDFHRTRLTHSLEVASIAKSIVRNIKKRTDLSVLPCDDLVTSISLLHDIGHPPFGHGGEVALNYVMRHHGNFEGNGQTLRLLTKLEDSYGRFGLDLTRRTLLGILKYPVSMSRAKSLCAPNEVLDKPITLSQWLPPKAYLDTEQETVDWILEPLTEEDRQLFQTFRVKPSQKNHGSSLYKSLDCSIMDIADDIAYGVHDLEDAIYLKLITKDQLNTDKFHQLYKSIEPYEGMLSSNELITMLFHPDLPTRKHAIGSLVNFFITRASLTTTNDEFVEPLLKYNVQLPNHARVFLEHLKELIYNYVIDSLEARTIEYGGQVVVQRLFEAIISNPSRLLNERGRERISQNPNLSQRVVCDYIADMTDEYAYRMHERLFGFNTRTVFERL
jgi:dGTPase